jgi:hypothetical protein
MRVYISPVCTGGKTEAYVGYIAALVYISPVCTGGKTSVITIFKLSQIAKHSWTKIPRL